MFFDPIECQAARDCLRRGNAVEAARTLLADGVPRDHKAVRQLLLEIGPPVVVAAEQAARDQQWSVATELLELAQACAALAPEAVALLQSLRDKRDEQRRQADWAVRQQQAAQRLAADGRLRTALEVIDRAPDGPDVARQRLEWTADAARLERYVGECREFLAAEQWAAARRCWEKAAEIAPRDPCVLELGQRFSGRAIRSHHAPRDEPRANDVGSRKAHHAERDGHIDPAGESALLSLVPFAPIEIWQDGRPGSTLVIARDDVVIGSGRNAAVDLALVGQLYSRHARLVRDADGYRLRNEFRDRHGGTWTIGLRRGANDRPVAHGEVAALVDGDELQFGHFAATFRLPAGAESAVLTAGAMWPLAHRDPARPVGRVVLYGGGLRAGPATAACHVPLAELWPAADVRLNWERAGLRITVGAAAFVQTTEGTTASGRRAFRVEVCAGLSPEEILGAAFATEGESVATEFWVAEV